jgi:hypothetical protein
VICLCPCSAVWWPGEAARECWGGDLHAVALVTDHGVLVMECGARVNVDAAQHKEDAPWARVCAECVTAIERKCPK